MTRLQPGGKCGQMAISCFNNLQRCDEAVEPSYFTVVAQIFNLLYRRIAFCRPAVLSKPRVQGDSLPIANRRYSRLKICATSRVTDLLLPWAAFRHSELWLLSSFVISHSDFSNKPMQRFFYPSCKKQAS